MAESQQTKTMTFYWCGFCSYALHLYSLSSSGWWICDVWSMEKINEILSDYPSVSIYIYIFIYISVCFDFNVHHVEWLVHQTKLMMKIGNAMTFHCIHANLDCGWTYSYSCYSRSPPCLTDVPLLCQLPWSLQHSLVCVAINAKPNKFIKLFLLYPRADWGSISTFIAETHFSDLLIQHPE